MIQPLWVLKTMKEKSLQRLVHISADLARQTATALDTIQSGISSKVYIYIYIPSPYHLQRAYIYELVNFYIYDFCFYMLTFSGKNRSCCFAGCSKFST